MMMEFKVNHADPGVPAEHGLHAPEDGPLTDQPSFAPAEGLYCCSFWRPQPPTLSRRTNCNPDPARVPGILKATLLPLEKGVEKRQQHTEPEQEVGGAGYCVFLLLLWFILLNFPFLFLLILIDNIPSCPGLCSHQVCQVGRCPCPSQTLGFPFGSSLEPSRKGGRAASVRLQTFFLTFFGVYRNVLTKDQVCS